jgi:caa(3)-type oxidase subunit IV
MSDKNQNRGAAYRQSVMIALFLAVLTVAEYFVAVEFNSLVILMLIALFKAVLVVNYYMHVQRLWKTEEEH